MDNLDRKVISENLITYENNIEAYNEYLNFVAYLVKTLAYPENALSAATITNKLVRDGIFSKNSEFKYVYSLNDSIEGFLGLNVINGYGNSRHISTFINDVLNKLGFDSFVLPVKVTNNREIDDEEKYTNQAFCIINHHGNLYGYDVTNNLFYHFNGNNKMKEIHSNNPLYAHYNLDSSVDEYANYSDKEIISSEGLKLIMNYTKRVVNKDNALLFNEVIRYSKPFIDRIIYGISNVKTKKRK